MDVDFLRLRKRFIISNQAFEMKRQRLLNVLKRLSDTCARREATWHIGNGHAVVRLGVLVQYDRKFHCASPLVFELKPLGCFKPACFRLLCTVPLGRSLLG